MEGWRKERQGKGMIKRNLLAEFRAALKRKMVPSTPGKGKTNVKRCRVQLFFFPHGDLPLTAKLSVYFY